VHLVGLHVNGADRDPVLGDPVPAVLVVLDRDLGLAQRLDIAVCRSQISAAPFGELSQHHAAAGAHHRDEQRDASGDLGLLRAVSGHETTLRSGSDLDARRAGRCRASAHRLSFVNTGRNRG
jgi:hypothetical protein